MRKQFLITFCLITSSPALYSCPDDLDVVVADEQRFFDQFGGAAVEIRVTDLRNPRALDDPTSRLDAIIHRDDGKLALGMGDVVARGMGKEQSAHAKLITFIRLVHA